MLRRSIRASALAVGLVALLAATVAASITFNRDTGGFAGKGDIQTAFGWTNAQLQANAAGVGFQYITTTTTHVSWTCTNSDTGDIRYVVNDSTTYSHVYYATTPRGAKGKVTGFDFVKNGADGGGGGGAGCDTGYLLSDFVFNQTSSSGLYALWSGQQVLLIAG